MMLPISPRMEEQMKNHRLPKMSDSRPTRVKPTASPAVQEMETQIMFGEGPMAALMRVRVFEGSTQPRYPAIWAKQLAWKEWLGH
jgi:hypothetical protein